MAVREAFRAWLKNEGYSENTISTQSTQAARIEGSYGDLDAAYDLDNFASIEKSLQYSKDDERNERPNPAKFEINGDVYSNLAGYRTTLNYYSQFRVAEASVRVQNLSSTKIDTEALEKLKSIFLSRYPDFAGLLFTADHGTYWDEERGYKEKVFAGAETIMSQVGLSDEDAGRAMIELLRRPPANFVGWRAFKQIEDAGPDAGRKIAIAIGTLIHGEGDGAALAASAAATIHPLIMGGTLGNPAFGQVRSLVTTALALVRPKQAIAVKTRYLQRVAKQLIGHGVFTSKVMTANEFRQVLEMAHAIFAVMRDNWDWKPRDLWDVQGFLWATKANAPTDSDEDAVDEGDTDTVSPQATAVVSTSPTNLIVYGPPGTGKTYVTAAKAVAICDGKLPSGGRDKLMQRYKELVERKRISFITFHQSYSYEDFVEGLRPKTNRPGENPDEPTSGGFSLEIHPGVFRQIAELARDNRGPASEPKKLDRTRQAFKMSLGRSGDEEDAQRFSVAIKGRFVSLGWGGEIDWSAPQYDDFTAIKTRWQQDNPGATGHDPNIVQIYTLRANMKIGDIVIISDGNRRFRAVGELIGPYYYKADEPDAFNHRRAVRWLWHNDEGQPRELIYHRGFSQVSAYQLDSSQLDWPALEQLVNGAGTAAHAGGVPEPYVLIVDEINRANVSKVFGELITLIEPDKRLGAQNALTVTLPYSGDTFGVPGNLHIIGTMNTADRSIALLDTALRRRFEFEEMTPDVTTLVNASAATGVDLQAVLLGMNARIEYLFDREHQIGHAFFIGCQNYSDLTRVMRRKVIPLLAEYFYENWEKVRRVLGESADQGQFVSRVKLDVPNGVDEFAAEDGRWRYLINSDFLPSAFEQLKA